ncbi:MAG TPA: NeuD/PglB/VioB family sugar acetyltransferase [Terriglobales bacterium]
MTLVAEARDAPIQVVGVGSGGHAKVLLDALRSRPDLVIVGLTDANRDRIGVRVLGVPVLGSDALLVDLRAAAVTHAFLGIGPAVLRQRLFEQVSALGFTLMAVVHPSATVAADVECPPALVVLAQAVIGPGTRLGVNVIVNTAASIDHDCIVGAHVHVAPGARLGGGVAVGAGAHVGLGACVREGIRIGAGALVGAGAVVVRDVAPGIVVAGNPARPLKRPAPKP